MFECSICGLLSLNAISCPACGSQNLVDLSKSDSQTDDLPSEIPGLDEAAESWHELEGLDGDSNDSFNSANPATVDGSLPFGYSGESNVQVSRLPFGIGSHADGIPFDNQPITTQVQATNEENDYTHASELHDDDENIMSTFQPEITQSEAYSAIYGWWFIKEKPSLL